MKVKTGMLVILGFVLMCPAASADYNISDGVVQFWNVNSVQDLYVELNNESLLSLDNEIYTMHVPFYQNASDETFVFNVSVHMDTANTSSRAYFQFNNTTFVNATIIGWSTVLDAPAPNNYTYRPYVWSGSGHAQNITGTTFTNLGDSSTVVVPNGVSILGMQNKTISDCTFENNSLGLYLTHALSDAIPLGDPTGIPTQDNIIENCVFRNNVIHGFYLHEYNFRNTVRNCTSYTNGANGFTIYQGQDNIFTNTTMYNDTSAGVVLYAQCVNNTFTDTSLTDCGVVIQSVSNNSSFTNTDINIVKPAITAVYLYSNASNNSFINTAVNGANIGVYARANSTNNTFTNITINASQTYSVYEYQTSGYNAFENVMITNNKQIAVRIYSSPSTLLDNVSIINTEVGYPDFSIESGSSNITLQNLNTYNIIKVADSASRVWVKSTDGRIFGENSTALASMSESTFSMYLNAIQTIYVSPVTLYSPSTGGVVSFEVTEWGPSYIWNETSSTHSAITSHTITGFPAHTNCWVLCDGILYTTARTNAYGAFSWDYTGGFSTHTFEIQCVGETAGVRTAFVSSWSNTVSLVGAIIVIALAGSAIAVFRGKRDISDLVNDLPGIVLIVVLLVVGAIIFGQF